MTHNLLLPESSELTVALDRACAELIRALDFSGLVPGSSFWFPRLRVETMSFGQYTVVVEIRGGIFKRFRLTFAGEQSRESMAPVGAVTELRFGNRELKLFYDRAERLELRIYGRYGWTGRQGKVRVFKGYCLCDETATTDPTTAPVRSRSGRQQLPTPHFHPARLPPRFVYKSRRGRERSHGTDEIFGWFGQLLTKQQAKAWVLFRSE